MSVSGFVRNYIVSNCVFPINSIFEKYFLLVKLAKTSTFPNFVAEAELKTKKEIASHALQIKL